MRAAALAARLALRQIPSLVTPSLAVVTLVALPLTSVAFLALMSGQQGQQLAHTSVLAALAVAAVTACGLMTAMAIGDRYAHASSQLQASGGLLRPALWGRRIAFAAGAGWAVGGVVALAGSIGAPGLLPRVGLGALTAAPAGACAGFTLALLSLPLRDPGTTGSVFALLAPLLGAVLLPISAYPAWLRPAVQIWPGTHAIEFGRGGDMRQVGAEVLVAAGWLAAGVLGGTVVVRLARRRGTLLLGP